jgi:hypothetical protein
MTIVPDDIKPDKERCEGCIHFDDFGHSPMNDMVGGAFGECICPYSDHYGHIISFGHPGCQKKEE